MNCGRFRFLIQQRFDVEISPQDDHALLIHLETCESCQKFHHQVQQVILASEELAVPEELLPQKPEALARKIMEELPAPKKSIFGSFFAMFGGLNKNGTPPKIAAPIRQARESAFPHPQRPQAGSPPVQRKLTEQEHEEAQTMKGRLNTLPKANTNELGDSRDAQSTTRSLGERFGNAPITTNVLDDQPLTLADAIRRKNLESKSSQDITGAQEAPPPGALQPSDWSNPSSIPVQPLPPGNNAPIAGAPWNTSNANSANSGFPSAPPRPLNESGNWNVFDPSAGIALPAGINAGPTHPKDIPNPFAMGASAPQPQVQPSAPQGNEPQPWSDSWAAQVGQGPQPDPWQTIPPDQQGLPALPAAAWEQGANKVDPWGQPTGAPGSAPQAGPANDPWGPIVTQQPSVQPIQAIQPEQPGSAWQSTNNSYGTPTSAAQGIAGGGVQPVQSYGQMGSAAGLNPPFAPAQAPDNNMGANGGNQQTAQPANQNSEWGPPPQLGSWDAPADFAENWVRKPEQPSIAAPKPVLKFGAEEEQGAAANNVPPAAPWLAGGAPPSQPGQAAAFAPQPAPAPTPTPAPSSKPSLWEENPSFSAWEPAPQSAAPKPAEMPAPAQNIWAQTPAPSPAPMQAPSAPNPANDV
jgi:hypothetical protein